VTLPVVSPVIVHAPTVSTRLCPDELSVPPQSASAGVALTLSARSEFLLTVDPLASLLNSPAVFPVGEEFAAIVTVSIPSVPLL
jgi:hypothetical protein